MLASARWEPGRAIRAEVVSGRGAKLISELRRALRAPRFSGCFSRIQVTGLFLWCGAVVTAPPCASSRVQSSHLATQLAGPRRTLRSTLHDRFHVQDSPTHPGPRGLHPQRADFQSNSNFVSSLTTPTVCRAFQSFGALRNLPCAARETVRSIFGCRISSRVSHKVGARASDPLWRVCLKSLRKCGPEARAPTCECWRLSGG